MRLRTARRSIRRCVSATLKRTPYTYCREARKRTTAGGSSVLHSSSMQTGILISPWNEMRILDHWFSTTWLFSKPPKSPARNPINRTAKAHCPPHLGKDVVDERVHKPPSMPMFSHSKYFWSNRRQRWGGYVHVVAGCHREQWRDVGFRSTQGPFWVASVPRWLSPALIHYLFTRRILPARLARHSFRNVAGGRKGYTVILEWD